MVDRLHTADDVWGGTVEFRPTTVSASENIAIRQSRLSFAGRLPRPYAIILSHSLDGLAAVFGDDALVVLDGDAFAGVAQVVHAFMDGAASDGEHGGGRGP